MFGDIDQVSYTKEKNGFPSIEEDEEEDEVYDIWTLFESDSDDSNM